MFALVLGDQRATIRSTDLRHLLVAGRRLCLGGVGNGTGRSVGQHLLRRAELPDRDELDARGASQIRSA
jgi:hypothetical protein